MTALTILRPGLLTTVQDLGRWGYQDRGVPVAGPMDVLAHRAANALVGNEGAAATLEVTLTGPEVSCSGPCVMATTGAAFALTVGDRPVPTQERFDVPAGARVAFGARVSGARAYLAVSGGIDVPPVLGSRATHVLAKMGGLEGRPLRAGDRLPLGTARARAAGPVRSDVGRARSGDGPVSLRVLPGPQRDWFPPDALEALTRSPYTVETNSDRTGFRMLGSGLSHAGRSLISEATPLGSLQVPPSGQPILLMADRQTAGGYPKIATVIAADLPAAGQLAPGDSVRFVVCTLREALAALIAQERSLLAIEAYRTP